MSRQIPARRPSLAERALDLDALGIEGAKVELRSGRGLEYRFTVAPSEWGRRYGCVLRVAPDGYWPEVLVQSPSLDALAGGKKLPHVYPHNGLGTKLCLWWPKNREWSWRLRLSETFVPWTAEWLWFFEDWLYTGTWAGGGQHPPQGSSRPRWRRH
jgi:hypothetical protein